MKQKLTIKQENIYNIIKKFIDQHGYSPTIREICNIAGFSSSATGFEYIKKLQDKGYITYIENRVRTIRIKE